MYELYEVISFSIVFIVILGIIITGCIYSYKSKRAEISVIVREKTRVARVSVKCKAAHTEDVRNILKNIFKESDISIT